MTKNSLREKLADLEHQQWRHWTGYMILKWSVKNCRKWSKQILTPYSELTEKEKDSDRKWADKSLALFRKIIEKWEEENKEVLKTEDIVKEKIIIADYIKWDKVKELLKQLK